MPMSLSPRPERLTMIERPGDPGARAIASATAWADSSAGRIPSRWHNLRTAETASSSEQEV